MRSVAPAVVGATVDDGAAVVGPELPVESSLQPVSATDADVAPRIPSMLRRLRGSILTIM